jgi:hypothetical protein
MASGGEILAVLETLSRAYPHQAISRPTAELYARLLADIPAGLLQQAAEAQIGSSSFYPRIAELRAIAARLAGTKRFDSLPPAGFDYTTLHSTIDELAYQAQALEDVFYQGRSLDPEAWLVLADQFDQADQPHRAEYTRRKLAGLQAVLEQEAGVG